MVETNFNAPLTYTYIPPLASQFLTTLDERIAPFY